MTRDSQREGFGGRREVKSRPGANVGGKRSAEQPRTRFKAGDSTPLIGIRWCNQARPDGFIETGSSQRASTELGIDGEPLDPDACQLPLPLPLQQQHTAHGAQDFLDPH